ncbi:hypothetical protein [Streptomyces sp. SM10]|uniref:hypothetical protein n=1 Tax=Streptomyces sp. SM10 TaxID=565556 RepID=UPI000CD4A0CA|nr:hypothetical protein [Streptomyces sp. SM10]
MSAGSRPTALVTGAGRAAGIAASLVLDLARHTPLGRLKMPQDCAHPVTFLGPAEGGLINGRLLQCDGGLA